MTLTMVRKIISKLVFNPRKDKVLKIVCEADNLAYFECRAIELIKIATKAREEDCPRLYEVNLIKATQLLIMAGVKYETTKAKISETREEDTNINTNKT